MATTPGRQQPAIRPSLNHRVTTPLQVGIPYRHTVARPLRLTRTIWPPDSLPKPAQGPRLLSPSGPSPPARLRDTSSPVETAKQRPLPLIFSKDNPSPVPIEPSLSPCQPAGCPHWAQPTEHGINRVASLDWPTRFSVAGSASLVGTPQARCRSIVRWGGLRPAGQVWSPGLPAWG